MAEYLQLSLARETIAAVVGKKLTQLIRSDFEDPIKFKRSAYCRSFFRCYGWLELEFEHMETIEIGFNEESGWRGLIIGRVEDTAGVSPQPVFKIDVTHATDGDREISNLRGKIVSAIAVYSELQSYSPYQTLISWGVRPEDAELMSQGIPPEPEYERALKFEFLEGQSLWITHNLVLTVGPSELVMFLGSDMPPELLDRLHLVHRVPSTLDATTRESKNSNF
jgi:hypothetical protein